MNTLTVVLPIFTVVAVGFILRHYNVIKKSWIDVLNSYVYFIALPALVISSQLTLNLKDGAVVQIIGWNWMFLTIAAIISGLIVKLLPIANDVRRAVYLSSIIGNSVYLGVPMVTGVFHSVAGSPDYATTVLIGVMQLMWAIVLTLLGIEFMSSKRFNIRRVIDNLSKNPLLWSLIVGIALSLLPRDASIEAFYKPTLTMIAATASPIALITLGAFMYGAKRSMHVGPLVYVTVFKLAIIPLIAWCVFSLTTGFSTMEKASILYSGMPVAVTAFVLSQKYKLNPGFVATAMLVTTAVSFFGLSMLMVIVAN